MAKNEISIEKIFLRIIKTGIFILPFTPLVFVPGFFFPFITWKNFVFRIVVEIIGSLWISLAILNKDYRPKFNKIFYAISAFILVGILSTIFSVDPFRSFWSNFERMEGLITYLHLFWLYLVISTVFKKEREWIYLFFVSLGVSFFVSFYGFLEKAKVISSLTQGGRIFSTLGNSIYLAVYLLFHIFFAALAYVRTREAWLKSLLLISIAVNFVAFIFAESRGALIGFVASVFLALTLSLFAAKKTTHRYAILAALFIMISAPFILYASRDFVRSKNIPGISRFASFSLQDATTVSRLRIWRIAYTAIQEKPIFGWGLENFQIPFAVYYNPDLFDSEPWFDRTHNVVLDWFVSAGILGGISYLAIFIILLWTVFDLTRSGKLSKKEGILAAGLAAGYLVQNLSVFDNITSHILFFSFLGFITFRETNATDVSYKKSDYSQAEVIYPALFLAFGLFLAIYLNAGPIMQSRSLIKSMNVVAEGKNFDKAMEDFEKTLGYGGFGVREVREQLLNLTNAIVSSKTNLTQEQVLRLVNLTKDEFKKETEEYLSPKHQILRAGANQQYYSLTRLGYQEALDEYQKALEIAPKYTRTYFGLIQLYINRNNKEKTLETIDRVKELKPRSGEFWRTILAGYILIGDEKGALDAIKEAKDLGVAIPPDGFAAVGAQARGRGMTDFAILLFKESLTPGYETPLALVSLAEIYAERGEYDEAISYAQRAKEINPSMAEEVEKFIESVNNARKK